MGSAPDDGVGLHADDIEIDGRLVRALVDRAAPELAGRSLRALDAAGSTNRLFRLGEDLLVRLPRQPGGSDTIAKEARWLPYVAGALPVAIPQVVMVGEPDLGYPERWSIVRWIAGAPPEAPIAAGGGAVELACDLGGVVSALRGLPVPPEALADPALSWYRGEPLAALDATFRRDLADCASLPGLDLDLGACLRLWEATTTLPGTGAVDEVRWLHGDLLAENLLVSDGRLTAVLDFGGLAVGDPTVDLVVGWELLDPSGREVFRSLLGLDEVTWLRGRAWALAIAVMTLPYYWNSMPGRCRARRAMARAVLVDAAS